MHCPSCGFDNPEGMKFCGRCGTGLSPRCPQYGFENPAGFAFCGQCGTPRTGQTPALIPSSLPPRPQVYTPNHLAEKSLTGRNALEGERQQVTMPFADLKGSMELLADRDPAEARQILEPVLERRMTAVYCDEGAVNNVMGNGLIALFWGLLVHEDRPYGGSAHHSQKPLLKGRVT
jgi:hypothetical protein